MLNSIDKLILRYVGQNTTGDESDVTLDELEWVECGKSYREIQSNLKRIIKAGMITEDSTPLRKFRYLKLTDKGREWFAGDITHVVEKPKKSKPRPKVKDLTKK